MIPDNVSDDVKKLAENLKKNGLASSDEEAVNKAKMMLGQSFASKPEARPKPPLANESRPLQELMPEEEQETLSGSEPPYEEAGSKTPDSSPSSMNSVSEPAYHEPVEADYEGEQESFDEDAQFSSDTLFNQPSQPVSEPAEADFDSEQESFDEETQFPSGSLYTEASEPELVHSEDTSADEPMLEEETISSQADEPKNLLEESSLEGKRMPAQNIEPEERPPEKKEGRKYAEQDIDLVDIFKPK
jgi:hypothetical protein